MIKLLPVETHEGKSVQPVLDDGAFDSCSVCIMHITKTKTNNSCGNIPCIPYEREDNLSVYFY